MTHPLTTILLAQRLAGTTLSVLDDHLVPPDLETAYRIQDETVAALGAVGAWKVTPMPETGTPACSPILAADIYSDGVTLQRSDFAGLAIEVEVAVTLRRDCPARPTAYTPAEMRNAIGSVHIALEVLSSRYANRRAVSQLAGFADLQSNGAIVLGAPLDVALLDELDRQTMSLRLDGTPSGSTTKGPGVDNVTAALAWLAGHAATRGRGLKTGDVVITGARIGPSELVGRLAQASSSALGTVSATFC